ncbi:EAL domain-containing protein [Pseudomonas sp. LFM046]|uniref:EAL domain-containing protein n=1 Tax=Pseudomonas sp. LFM046 TaxID=1608357 RepID=UPI0005CFE907|nr:EAL domain-containing protein [Pseudomonas sp. LFM046]
MPQRFTLDLSQGRRASARQVICHAAWLAEVRAQPIVNRQEHVVGFENLARIESDVFGGRMEHLIARLPGDELQRLTGEVLLSLRIRCMLDKNYSSQMKGERAGPGAFRHFVNVEKRSLAEPSVIDDLVESAADLRSSGAQLVVEVTERPVASGEQFRAYVSGLMRLKQEGVQVALDNYDIDAPVHWELDLGLCDFVKLELSELGIPLRGDEDVLAARYIGLAEKLYQFIHRYLVEVIADKVETHWQYEIAKGLPFKLFQGYRLGYSERV